MRSFDCVSIDSDLDSVCTQQVRAHVCRRSGKKQGDEKTESDGFIPWLKIQSNVSQVTSTGWRSLLQSVTGLGSDLDAASLDDSEPPTAPGAATQQRIHTNCKTHNMQSCFLARDYSQQTVHTEKIRAFIQKKATIYKMFSTSSRLEPVCCGHFCPLYHENKRRNGGSCLRCFLSFSLQLILPSKPKVT